MNMHNIYQEPSGILISPTQITDTTVKPNKAIIRSLIFSFLFSLLLPNFSNAQCDTITLGCTNVNLSIDGNCNATINADLIVTNSFNIEPLASCASMLKVVVYDINGNIYGQGLSVPINGNNPLTGIGSTISAQVFWDLNNNNTMDSGEGRCWHNILVEDKLPPVFPADCNDVTVYCYEDINNAAPPPVATDNCAGAGGINYTSTEAIQNFDCHVGVGPFDTRAIITRTIIATDGYDNKDTCVQTITVQRLPFVASNIASPANVSIECNNATTLDTAATTLGYPTLTFDNNGTSVTIELSPTNLSGYCSDIIVTYEDTPLNVSGCVNNLKEKFLREFTILNCCNNEVVTDVFQTISIVDTTVPSIVCPAALTVSSSSNSCLGNVFLPAATTSDACSNVTVSITTPNGVINSNGGFVSNLPLGTTTVTYTATDECGNTATCMMDVTVQDAIPPTVICDANTVVSLNNTGIVIINADVFDDGSYDNCGPITFEARRMTDNCGLPNNLIYRPFIEVCCADVGMTIMVQMRVVDAGGNTSSCMVELTVQDKMDPIIICPPNKTIECGSDFTDLGLTGQAVGSDNCGTVNITHTDVANVDSQCGTGTVTRTWTATDDSGATTSCIQTIAIINSSPFTGDSNPLDDDDILWPANLMNATAITCTNYLSDPSSVDPSNTGVPIIVGATAGCDMVLFGILENLVLVSNGVGKILRTWRVIDWCQYDENNPSAGGSWTHTQVIKVSDMMPPVLVNPPSNMTFSVDANCQATVPIPTISQSDISDCSSNVSISVSGDLGTSGSATVGIGDYNVTYTLTDAAGNTTTHNITIIVEDDTPPTVFCQSLSAPIMPGANMLTLQAKDFLNSNSTLDNCTSFENLSVGIMFEDQMVTGPPTATEITFTCDHLGETNVILWVCDESNRCVSCPTTMTLTDPLASCPPPVAMANISGDIDNEFGEGIEDVEVTVNNGPQMDMTDPSGDFSIENLPVNETYTFTPGKNTDPRNGVTTFDMVKIQKHILGNEFLDSPYKIIAADANGSGTITTVDLVAIRNLILLNEDEFPNDVPSWRFVDATFDFIDPSDPFAFDFPEEYVVQTLTEDMTDMNFVSIKVGDVNGSALPALTSSDTRNRIGELKLITKDQRLQKGEVGTLRLYADAIQDLEALQFSLTIETQYLQILNVEKDEEVYVGNSMLENGVLTACWIEKEMLENQTPWLELQYSAKEDLYLSDVIQLNSDYTPSEAYDVRGMLYDVALHFEPMDEKSIGKDFILYPNYPNPFTDETVISFYLPESDYGSLKIHDISGKVVKQITQNFEAGKNQVIVSSKEFSGTGLFFYTVETSKYRDTQKMFLLKK